MNDFKEYKAAFLEQNDLAHFGILGMKWGVRRYQNADGTLTPAGKKRYDRLIAKGNAFDAGKYGTETKEERDSRIAKDKDRKNKLFKKDNDRINNSDEAESYLKEHYNDLFTERNAKENFERTEEISRLGLKAMEKANMINRIDYDINEGVEPNQRDWFIYEDQTIGYATVADLALRGKTKEEINRLIYAAGFMPYEDHYKHGIFQLSEGYIPDEYLNALFAILNAEGRLK